MEDNIQQVTSDSTQQVTSKTPSMALQKDPRNVAAGKALAEKTKRAH